ncbi:MAG: M23 family metallopeptidase [Treponema sp.]|jgi:murein DD-endopeptidase MepM/ murein hydrolase activator NlpD|nr:M23 family metallopeptidase [Treponema sp.]
MIRFDNVDKEPIMNDIIAVQHVHRRKKPSLLSSASDFRAASFIERQKPARHRNRTIRSFTQSVSSFVLKNRFSLKPDQAYSPQNGPGPFANTFPLLVLGLLGVFFFAGLIFFDFIPDPDPPEDTVPMGRAGIETVFSAETPGDEFPLDLMETFSWEDYTVRQGDTVEGISRRFGLSLDAVIASNNIRNVRRGLIAGETIRIPNMDGIPYTVKRGDSYQKIANSMAVPLEAILDANDIQSEAISPGAVLFIPGARMKTEDLKQALGELFIYPVQGRITSGFGWRIDPFTKTRLYHAGMDLSSRFGTPVKAAAAGRVSAVGYNAIYGNFVIITHNGVYQTMYGHLSKILVSKGSSVGQGDVVGQVGSTGRSTGPHLHFAVYRNDRAINPLEILNK